MDSDKVLYALAQADPAWLCLAAGRPLTKPGCQVRSVTFKDLERTADAVIFPDALCDAIVNVEFEMHHPRFILQRSGIEVAHLEMQHPERDVVGLVIVTERGKKALEGSPWLKLIRVLTLEEALDLLPVDYPVRHALFPMIETDLDVIETDGPARYKSLMQAKGLKTGARLQLGEVFMNLFLQRFPKLNSKELNAMFKLTPLRKCLAVQELMQEERKHALKLGREEGREEGIIDTACRQLTRKFGSLSKSIVTRIEALDYLQLESLTEALLDFESTKDVKAWLEQQAKPARRRR